jgi:hypothetical protein
MRIVLSWLLDWTNRGSRTGRTRSAARAPRTRFSFCPTLEGLEGRFAPASFTVDRSTDTGAGVGDHGDLRWCIDQVNRSTDPSNNITIDTAQLAGDITLTSQLPTIMKNVNIEPVNSPGLGSPPASLPGIVRSSAPGTGNFRLMAIAPDTTVDIGGLRFENGNAGTLAGGAISNAGALTLSGDNITGNSADAGGGLDNYGGTVYISGTSFTGNNSDGHGGAIYNDGGSVYLQYNSVVYDNRAINGSGGGIYNDGGTVGISDETSISANTAGGDGGGIYNDNGNLTMSGGTLTSNAAAGNGGGLYTKGEQASVTFYFVDIEYNQATKGGGIYDYPSSATFYSCTLSNNQASLGNGACYATPPGPTFVGGTITDTIVQDNNPGP